MEIKESIFNMNSQPIQINNTKGTIIRTPISTNEDRGRFIITDVNNDDDLDENIELVYAKIVKIEHGLVFANHYIQLSSENEKGLVLQRCEGCNIGRKDLGTLDFKKRVCLIIDGAKDVNVLSGYGQPYKTLGNNSIIIPGISSKFFKEKKIG